MDETLLAALISIILDTQLCIRMLSGMSKGGRSHSAGCSSSFPAFPCNNNHQWNLILCLTMKEISRRKGYAKVEAMTQPRNVSMEH